MSEGLAAWRHRLPIVLGAFAAVQAALVLLAANGPFLDEGIYAAAGLRVLEGHGLADRYAEWFAGSPFVWPPLSGAAYALAGLEGSRLAAVALSLVTLAAFAGAARRLVGPWPALLATAALSLNGLFAALAHFAVYDVPSLAGLALSLWLVTVHLETGRLGWLVPAGIAFAAAAVAKYGGAVMGPALLALLLAGARPPRRPWPSVVFCTSAAVALGAYLATPPGRAVLSGLHVYADAPYVWPLRLALSSQAYFLLVPLLLAVPGGWLLWRSGKRALALALGLALLVAPAYHLVSLRFVSAQKHVVMGFLFAYPLVGVALDRLRTSRPALVRACAWALLAGWGGLQWYRQEHAWPDLRPAIAYLTTNARPSDRVAAHQWSWALMPELYRHGLVDRPFAIADQWSPGAWKAAPCSFDFTVGRDAGPRRPGDPFVEKARACGAGRVLAWSSRSYHLGPWLAFGSVKTSLAVYGRRSPAATAVSPPAR